MIPPVDVSMPVARLCLWVAVGCCVGFAVACLPDAPPPPPSVRIEPAAPGPDDALYAIIDAPSADSEGTRVALTIRWSVDGNVLTTLAGTTVPPEQTRPGERWAVAVTASIGDAESVPGTATVLIGGAPGDDDDDDGGDDDQAAKGGAPGALCAGAGTATNGIHTVVTCTGPVATGTRVSNGTHTVDTNLGGIR